MIAVDTNLLVYCHRVDSAWHEQAVAVIARLAEGNTDWAIPWPCLWEFLAVVTHPRIYAPPTPITDAVEEIDRWLGAPRVHLLAESDSILGTIRTGIVRSRVQGPRVHDARIAAICLVHGVDKLLTADRDFARFPDLRTENPLVGS